MKVGPWLVLLTPVDSIWFSSVIPGLMLEKGLGISFVLVPWMVLELLLLPVLMVDMETGLESGVVGTDVEIMS